MPEEKQEQLISPEEEIRVLEQKLEAKKKELADKQESIPEKDVFREVLREHINQAKTEAQPTAPVAVLPVSGANDVEEKKKRIEKVERLVQIAMARSIPSAVKTAESEHNPYLLDALHDELVDHYYEKLLALRKIKQM